MPPTDESAASPPNPPFAPGKDPRATQPPLHTARLTLVPLTDEHLELEVELDSDAEVMRYLTGSALSRAEVERAHQRWVAAARTVPGSDFGSDSTAMTSSAGGSWNRRTGPISRRSPTKPTLATGCRVGTGAAATPLKAHASLSGTASPPSASTGSSPRPWRSTHRRGRR
jgi:hypothetical protein